MSTAVHISVEEFIARPDRDDDQREELIEGEVIVSPGAKPSHAEIVERLREQLVPLKQRGYQLANDFSCILGGRSMPVPDLVAITRERWTAAIENDTWLMGSPELVIEVSSPSNRKVQRKAALYLENWAEQVWLVYPKTKTVSVVTPEAMRASNVLEFHGVSVQADSIFASA